MSLKIYLLLVLPLLSKQSGVYTTDNCKNFKCPPQEDLTCIKVEYRKGFKNVAFNVIVYNKCEIEYIKCHAGLKAYVLPMHKCHPTNEISILRPKREIKKGVRSFHKIGKGKKVYLYGDILTDSASDEANSHEKQRLNSKKVNKEKQENEKFDDENDETPRMDSTEALVELNSTSREKRLPMPSERDTSKNEDRPESINDIEEQVESQDDIQNDGVSNEYNDRYKQSNGTVQSEEVRMDTNSGEKKPVYNYDVGNDKDYHSTDEKDANLDEDNKDCPSTCASRDTMVCARCNHGVYRTFMSVCNLRAFLCAHTDEKLSLVSRLPCMQSAPFLSDLPPTKGRVHEPRGNDRVLQFIRCRAEGGLNKKDPKCNFDD